MSVSHLHQNHLEGEVACYLSDALLYSQAIVLESLEME